MLPGVPGIFLNHVKSLYIPAAPFRDSFRYICHGDGTPSPTAPAVNFPHAQWPRPPCPKPSSAPTTVTAIPPDITTIRFNRSFTVIAVITLTAPDMGVSAPSRAKEENIIQEEAAKVPCGQGIEGCHGVE